MTDMEKVILITLGLLFVLCAIVSLTLRHYIGGFLAEVAREEEAPEEESADGDKPASAGQENKS